MRASDDRPADRPSPDASAATTEDAFAPGGEPRESPDEEPRDAAESGGDQARELEEQRDRYLRLAAEFDNFRRRTQRERQEAGARAQAELVKQLLDALDDLERFAQLDPAKTNVATVVEGVTLVGRKLQKTLVAAGLEVVDPSGEAFDPARHEALATAPAGSADEDSTVAQVYQPGYVFAGQLLRPARVVVRQWNG